MTYKSRLESGSNSFRAFSDPTQANYLVAALKLVAGIAVVLVVILSSRGKESTFQERGLPADLPHYLPQIHSLKAPAEVLSLTWLPSTLRELDVSGTEIEVIPFVPLGMERLDVHAAKNLKQLPALPASLHDLDIRFTQLVGPWRLPHGLESLALGGDRVETLEGLTDLQLRELTLAEVVNLRSTAGLPTTLQVLSISGAPFSQLVDIPPQLKELRLENTQVRTLKGLPESLQSMTLIGNGVIEAELPRGLLSLTLGARQRLSPLAKLAFLNHLDLKEWVALSKLPSFLRELQVPTVREAQEFPSGLRRLEVGQGGEAILAQLPSGLEALRYPGLSNLSSLPLGLKHLSIPYSPLADLSGLPPEIRLESLDVSLTSISIDRLPSSLVSLKYQFCARNPTPRLPSGLRNLVLKGSASISEFQELPPRLEVLDVSETSITKLPMLPDTLTELDISSTPINDIRDLKHLWRLRRLTVHAGQLESLAGLPASVSELRFVDKR